MGYAIGIDVSTTATKAVLIDEDGAVTAVGSCEYDYEIPRPLWSEQDPGLWWDATVASVRSVLNTSGVAASEVAAIGLTGQMNVWVLLDSSGDVIRPALLWNDRLRDAGSTPMMTVAHLMSWNPGPAPSDPTPSSNPWSNEWRNETPACDRHPTARQATWHPRPRRNLGRTLPYRGFSGIYIPLGNGTERPSCILSCIPRTPRLEPRPSVRARG